MDLYCSVCFFIAGKGDTEAMIVAHGYSLCEDHTHVSSLEGFHREIAAANKEASPSRSTESKGVTDG